MGDESKPSVTGSTAGEQGAAFIRDIVVGQGAARAETPEEAAAAKEAFEALPPADQGVALDAAIKTQLEDAAKE